MVSLGSPLKLGGRPPQPPPPMFVSLRIASRAPAFGTELCAHHAAFPQQQRARLADDGGSSSPRSIRAAQMHRREYLYGNGSRALRCWADATRSGANNSAGDGRVWRHSRYWASRELEVTEPRPSDENCREKSALSALEQVLLQEAQQVGRFLPDGSAGQEEAAASAVIKPSHSFAHPQRQQQHQRQMQQVLPEWALEMQRCADYSAAERAAEEATRVEEEAHAQREGYAAWKLARDAAKLDKQLRSADLGGSLMKHINETRSSAARSAAAREERARERQAAAADAALHARVLREAERGSSARELDGVDVTAGGRDFVNMNTGVSIETTKPLTPAASALASASRSPLKKLQSPLASAASHSLMRKPVVPR